MFISFTQDHASRMSQNKQTNKQPQQVSLPPHQSFMKYCLPCCPPLMKWVSYRRTSASSSCQPGCCVSEVKGRTAAIETNPFILPSINVSLCVCVTGVQRWEDQQRDPLQATAPLQQRWVTTWYTPVCIAMTTSTTVCGLETLGGAELTVYSLNE